MLTKLWATAWAYQGFSNECYFMLVFSTRTGSAFQRKSWKSGAGCIRRRRLDRGQGYSRTFTLQNLRDIVADRSPPASPGRLEHGSSRRCLLGVPAVDVPSEAEVGSPAPTEPWDSSEDERARADTDPYLSSDEERKRLSGQPGSSTDPPIRVAKPNEPVPDSTDVVGVGEVAKSSEQGPLIVPGGAGGRISDNAACSSSSSTTTTRVGGP